VAIQKQNSTWPARLAGGVSVGVLCELVNSDGSMMRELQIDRFAHRLNLDSRIDCLAAEARQFSRNTAISRTALEELQTYT
jgi:3,4-dihydroxy-2-butanone 4-phosphate synthase